MGNGNSLWRISDPATFEATILTAASQLGIQPLAVEKDYWACEALRAIETTYPGQVIFKGGTSLEKLRIIDRFSEDLDLLVISDFLNLYQAKNAMRGMCRAARTATDGELTHVTSGGENGQAHKSMYLTIPVKHKPAENSGLADPGQILLEFGQSGGTNPSTYREVTSLLSRSLSANGFNIAAHGDLASFQIQILHPGRTLIEKLLRVNNFALMEDADRNRHGWPRIGRQFYDLWQLLGTGEVIDFLADKNLSSSVLENCFKVSKDFTPDRLPPRGGFANSSIFSESGELFERLSREHETAMKSLYFGKPLDLPLIEVFGRIKANEKLLDFRLN